MTILKNKILEIRVDLNLSREKFAKSLGYSKSYVADIETGRTKPSRRFLEKISSVCGVSIDWLLSESTILALIEANKITENPDLIFTYAFTQKGIDGAEKRLKEILADRNYLLVDARGVKSTAQFMKRIYNKENDPRKIKIQLWERLEYAMLYDEVVLIVKNLSLSEISDSGDLIRSIFKIMDDAWDKEASKKAKTLITLNTQSSLIVLDFPSYLEKNVGSFGYYAIPIYMGHPPYLS